MTLPNRNSHTDFNAASLLRSVRSALPILLIISLMAGLVTFGIFSLLKPKAVAEVQLQLRQTATTRAVDDTTRLEGAAKGHSDRIGGTPLAQHVAALGSRPILLVVASKLELARRPEFSGAGNYGISTSLMRMIGFGSKGRTGSERAVLSAIRQGLKFATQSDRDVITIRFEGRDAPLAVRLVNELAEAYRRHLAEAPAAASKREIADLTSNLAKSRNALVPAEMALEKLRADARAAQVEDPRLNALKQRLVKAEDERQRSEAAWQAALKLPKTADLGSLGNSKVFDALRAVAQRRARARQQLAKANKRLLPAHPRLQRLRGEVGRLDRIFNRELARQTKVLEHAFRTAVLRLQDLRGEFAALSAKTVKPSIDMGRLAALEADVNTKRSQLQALEGRINESKARAASLEPVARAEAIAPARLVGRQSASLKVRYTLIAMLVAFILGGAFVLAREALVRPRRLTVPTVKAVSEAEAIEPSVGMSEELPVAVDLDDDSLADEEPTPKSSSGDEAVHAALHEFVEIDGVAEHLLERGQDVNGLRSMIIGEWQGIDPSDEAIELAHQLSQFGAQVILIDWSPDRDGLTELIGLAHRPGISELMRGAVTFEDVITNVPDSRIHHMSTGLAMNVDFIGKNGELGSDSECLNMILDALDDVYDHIVVVGRYNAATTLFEAIEGRFDAGIIVCEGKRAQLPRQDENTFLGFEVADIDIVRYCRTMPAALTDARVRSSAAPTVYA
ncbi:MAG: GumC family protein [Hyphomicrobiaceae bacterium]